LIYIVFIVGAYLFVLTFKMVLVEDYIYEIQTFIDLIYGLNELVLIKAVKGFFISGLPF
jgi:hypothetical protein